MYFLGLKRVTATCYKSQDVDLFTQKSCEKAVYQIYDGDANGNREVDDEEIAVKELDGDGSFDSPECLRLLDEADVIVTNPPFSLFREFLAWIPEGKCLTQRRGESESAEGVLAAKNAKDAKLVGREAALRADEEDAWPSKKEADSSPPGM